MSTLPTTSPSIPAVPQKAAPVHSAGPAQAGSIDPIKLLNRHKWLLVGAGVVGGIVGTGANYGLEEIYPIWKPTALFQCTGPVENIRQAGGGGGNDIEMNRFMQTQIRFMTSDTVLQKVVEDPSLQSQAKVWCTKFMRKPTPNATELVFDSVKAQRWLKDDLTARIVPNTSLIELSYSGHQKADATAIVGLVREKYMAVLADSGQRLNDERTKSLSDTITRADAEILALQTKRQRLIDTNSLESVDERVSANQLRLQQIQEELLKVDGDLRQLGKQLEMMKGEIDNPAGYVASDQLKEQVDKDPLILDIKGRISRYEDELQMMLQTMSRDHREYKSMEARIVAAKKNLEEEKTRLFRQLFDSDMDRLTKQIAQLQERQTGLTLSRDEASKRQVALTQFQTDAKDIERQIEGAIKSRSATGEDKQTIISLSQLATANRVVIYQPEHIPSELSFPQLKFMIPLGVILGMGLVGGIVFLREIVDQRVKSPSDITLMPRMKLLGWVPDAAEDPEGKGAAETAFRDRPRGIIAESFRQLRSTIGKRLDTAGHKSLLVMSGMPGSGASSVASNLALAMAAADKKVLIIDANFRRPSLHRVFGVQESPGLADILGGSKSIEDAVQHSSTPNVDVLSVGSKELRVVERLAAQAKGDLLAKLKAMYDMVIIDVAPAVVAGDGIALAHRVDATLLVVRAMADKRGMVSRIRNDLGDSRSEFLGVVVNGVRASAGGYMKGNIKAAAEYAKA